MAHKITANFRRVFSIKPYETESVEFGVEMEVEDGKDLKKAAAKLYYDLAELGDKVVEKRLETYQGKEG